MKVYLIRHGESEGNANKNKDGEKRDWNLTKKGKEQAKRLARELNKLDITEIYTSGLRRTFQTAEPYLKKKKIEFIEDKRLNEFKFGKHSGNWEESIKLRERLAKKQNLPLSETRLPGGESFKEHYDKVSSFMKDLTKKKHEGNVLVFAHGGTNRNIIKWINNWDLNKHHSIPQSNTAINELEWDGKEWKIHRINSLSHLPKPKKAIKIFNKIRDTKYDLFTNNCWDKHRKLEEKLKKANYESILAVEKFNWDDQKLPEEILKLSHPKIDYHLYLLIWIHGTGIILDCTFDKKLPYYNKWDGENHTKV